MAKLVGTVAKVDAFGVWAHKHEGSNSWHWASAGHGSEPFHAKAKASAPTFPDGTSAGMKSNYANALARKAGFVSQSKAKANNFKGVFVQARKVAAAPKEVAVTE